MTRLPKVISTVSEMRHWRRTVKGKVGLVPTMGALHEGHATLLRKSRSLCDHSVLSIFVNPAQFGPNEDLSHYPRTFEKDLNIAARENVEIVFAPQVAEIYPPGYTTYVEETSISLPLCGKFRLGHFRGVTTIVLKLFNLIRPEIAFFGLKDAQQFFVLEKMVRDLNLDVQVIGVSTVRETDGLALSSRNAYLNDEERTLAPRIYQELQNIGRQVQCPSKALSGDLVVRHSISHSIATLNQLGFKVQYLEWVSLPDFQTTDFKPHNSALISIAAFLGNTRLIDNLILCPEKLWELGFYLED